MRAVAFGFGCGMVYFGLALFGVFDGIAAWRQIVGFVLIALGCALVVDSVDRR